MPDQGYVFLSGVGKSYDGRVRAHVLRRYYQEKRRVQSNQKILENAPSDATSPIVEISNLSGAGEHQQAINPPAIENSTWNEFLLPGERVLPESGNENIAACGQIIPNSICNASQRKDKWVSRNSIPYFNWSLFDTLVIPLNQRKKYLLQHFARCEESPIYQLDSGHVRFNPPRDISFRHLVNDEAGSMAMATAASYEVSFLRTGTVGEEAIRFETRLISLLNSRISQALTCCDDISILLAVVFITRDCEAFIETMTRSRLRVLHGHIAGLRQMIIRRGGYTTFAKNPRVGWTLYWYDLVNGGELASGLTPYSPYTFIGHEVNGNPLASGPTLDQRRVTSNKDENSLQMGAWELTGLYTSLYIYANDDCNAHSQLIQHRLSALVPSDQTLFTKISTFNDGPTLDRFAVLVYLTAVVLSLQDAPKAIDIEAYFDVLQLFVKEQNLYRTPSLWVFYWVLMVEYGSFNLENPERVWLTSRLIWTVKRLQLATRMKVEESFFLLLFRLNRSEVAQRDSDSSPLWSPGDFARSIQADLGF